MSRFLFGMVTGAVLLFIAMHYHVVKATDGVYFVPKISNNLSDVYVDIREFGLQDWNKHKTLAAAIVQADRSELIGDSSMAGFKDSMHSIVDGLFSDAQLAMPPQSANSSPFSRY